MTIYELWRDTCHIFQDKSFSQKVSEFWGRCGHLQILGWPSNSLLVVMNWREVVDAAYDQSLDLQATEAMLLRVLEAIKLEVAEAVGTVVNDSHGALINCDDGVQRSLGDGVRVVLLRSVPWSVEDEERISRENANEGHPHHDHCGDS